MYYRPSIFLSLILALILNRKKSQVSAIIGDDTERHTNTECAVVIQHYRRFICSGTLVVSADDVDFVLTTAKCLWNGSNTPNSHIPAEHIKIYTWTPNFKQVQGNLNEPRKVVLHQKFDPRYLTNNIAIIFLKKFVEQVEGQFQACKMPTKDTRISGGVVMMGFGTQNIEYPPDGRLGKVVVPYVNDNVCKTFHKHSPEDGHFCVGWLGKGGVGPCMGDEGGPALGRRGLERDFYLAGIYSHTPTYGTKLRVGCVDSRAPSLVTDVRFHIDWITDEIRKRDIPD